MTFGGQKLFTGSKKTNLKAIENKIVKIELNCKLHSLNIEDRMVICKEIEKTKIDTIENIFSFKNFSTFFHAATDIKLEGNFTHYAVVCRFLRQRFCFFPHQWLHFIKRLVFASSVLCCFILLSVPCVEWQPICISWFC